MRNRAASLAARVRSPASAFRRTARAALATLVLLALAPAPRADGPPKPSAVPANEELPELVWIVGIEGAPSDSLLRAAFDRGFKLGAAAPARHGATSGDRAKVARPAADVVLIIHSPAMIEANARPMPVRWRLIATDPPASAPAYARSLGRSVALLGLEHMHHLLETLPEDDRLVIEGFERTRPAVAELPGRR